MHPSTRRVLTWLPRTLTILLALFLGVFAADAFQGQSDLAHRLVSLAMHLLPSALVVVVLVLAWRWAWVGAIVFFALAAAYTLFALHRPLWILTIAGPAYLIAVLYGVSATTRKPRSIPEPGAPDDAPGRG